MVAASYTSVGNQHKLWSAASGIRDMTNKMCLLRTFDRKLLPLALFLAGFCCCSNATGTNGKSASIFDALYFFYGEFTSSTSKLTGDMFVVNT